MALLVDIFGLLSVLLSGAAVVAQSLAVGGIAFILLVIRPFDDRLGESGTPILKRSRQMIFWSAVSLALIGLISLLVEASILVDTAEISWASAFMAQFSVTHAATMVFGIAVAYLTARSGETRPVALGVLAVAILVAATLTTHAMARLDNRLPLALAEGLHQAGAAVWIGGIPFFVVALARIKDGAALRLIGKRFSQMSLASVIVIFVAGMGMSLDFIGSVEAIYGTAYGIMVSTKVILFGVLLLFGFANFRTVERLKANPHTSIQHMRRFAEVEIGIGLTVFFAAASLTSLPPASDLTVDRVSMTEIVERLTPQWPRLSSPDHDKLALPALQAQLDAEAAANNARQIPRAFIPGGGDLAPRNAEDIAWSEYNHHWSGILVLAIGLLALIERTGRAPWARNWPLLFLVLAVFLFIRSDPENWPIGDIGFFESLRDPEVVQHRIFVIAITLFGLFEWGVRTGRILNPKAAYVFPIVTAAGAGLLLTHSHAIANIKDQLLIEMTHVPLALFGIGAGWARWLELRLEPKDRKLPALIWPICFVMVGIILLTYREA
jgi:putative copper resistance protein D